MNEHLDIPTPVLLMLNSVLKTELHLAELPLPDHPKLSMFNRFIRVNDIDAKSKQSYVVFGYQQVLKDKETGEEVNLTLPNPDWVIYKDTWSYLRGTDNQPLTAPYKEDITEGDNQIKVPSYLYMLWLMKNNKAGLLQLIQSYLSYFVRVNIDDLNKL